MPDYEIMSRLSIKTKIRLNKMKRNIKLEIINPNSDTRMKFKKITYEQMRILDH